MNRKIKELLKSLAIAVLMINAVFLAYKSEVFNEFLAEVKWPDKLAAYFKNGDQSGTPGNSNSERGEYDVAAKPIVVAIMGEMGTRYAAKHDDVLLESVYEKTVNIMGEALGSASQPESCTEIEWKAALALPGIYWDYQVEMPISALVRWLGMSTLNDNVDYADRFAVVVNEQGGVDVYYSNSEGYSKCVTAAVADSIGGLTLEFLPNGAYFAFESEEVGGKVDPYTLIMPEQPVRYIVEAENIIENEAAREQTAERLGISILGGTSYTEKDGTTVYVGVNGIMRISVDGEINYSVSDYDNYRTATESAMDDGYIIEQAVQLVSDIRADHMGTEEIYFSGIEKHDNGLVSVSFSYYIDGTKIVQRKGSAATVTYDNGRMVALDMWLHRYSLTNEKATLLPELQAAAIAGGIENNGSLNLAYYDDSSGVLSPAWIVE